jgi:hypothetical protein
MLRPYREKVQGHQVDHGLVYGEVSEKGLETLVARIRQRENCFLGPFDGICPVKCANCFVRFRPLPLVSHQFRMLDYRFFLPLQLRYRSSAEVALGELPLVVLLTEHRSHQPHDGRLLREDAQNVPSPRWGPPRSPSTSLSTVCAFTPTATITTATETTRPSCGGP